MSGTDDTSATSGNTGGSNGFSKIQALTKQPARPNGCTYWVTDSFLAGEYPTDRSGDESKTRQKILEYLLCGITHFIDLTQEGEKSAYTSLVQEEAKKLGLSSSAVVCRRFAIPDFGIPQSTATMTEILNAMDDAIEKGGHKVYVHCRGGIGRTGTTVGCYLARHGFTGEQALQETNRLFQNSDRSYESSCSPETPQQMDFVRSWSE